MKTLLSLIIVLRTVTGFTQPVDRYSVIISEFMADPTPAAGLPESEFIEIRNISSVPVQLQNWRISNGKAYVQIRTEFLLYPDSMLIICPVSAEPQFQQSAAALGLSGFPSLNNESGIIALYAGNGSSIHAVTYNRNMYGNELKMQGGWSLEMIDIRFPCIETGNWLASRSTAGGTPGKTNSHSGLTTKPSLPVILRPLADDSSAIVVEFSQSLDSATSGDIYNYKLSDGIGNPVSAVVIPPLFRKVRLQFDPAPEKGKSYLLEINPLAGCAGTGMTQKIQLQAGIPEDIGLHDLIISEILFNPRPGSSDYIELYNKSNRIKDLSKLHLGTRDAGGQVTGIIKCSEEQRLLFPGEYLVLSEDTVMLQREYNTKCIPCTHQVSSLPSFPDHSGVAVLMNEQGMVIDEFRYDEKMHFALLTNKEGVSLERIDFKLAAADSRNWHSAATDAGYGTPGYQNSQSIHTDTIPGDIQVSPVTFSPDQDGRDDLLTIYYRFPEPGYLCSILITDPAGRIVRFLVRKNLCGMNGYFRWDGLSENNQQLPMGGYIIIAEIFNLRGGKKIRRMPVVLARRF